MTLHRGLLNWGIFLIVLAAVPLAVQLGYLEGAAAGALLRLWPLILVGIGLGLILRFTPFHALGGVLAAGTLGLLAGALLAGGLGSIGGTCIGTGAATEGLLETRGGMFAGTGAQVDIELTCVELDVDRQPGSEWNVAARHAPGRPPRIDGAPDRLRLDGETGGAFVGGAARREWRVTLPQQQRLSVSVTLNASSAALSLGGGELAGVNGTFNASDVRVDLVDAVVQGSSLNLTFNASSGTLSLPAASLSANVTLNASSLNLCAAPEAGLRIQHRDTLSSHNFEQAGLSRSGDAWQTSGYDTTAVRIDLNLSSNVSSITLGQSGGCP
ncbi:hypothetical protein BH24CHL6_BH24CHL6_14260 [soil metagenome]